MIDLVEHAVRFGNRVALLRKVGQKLRFTGEICAVGVACRGVSGEICLTDISGLSLTAKVPISSLRRRTKMTLIHRAGRPV